MEPSSFGFKRGRRDAVSLRSTASPPALLSSSNIAY